MYTRTTRARRDRLPGLTEPTRPQTNRSARVMALQSGKFGLQLGAKDRDQSFPGDLHLQPWQLRSPASHLLDTNRVARTTTSRARQRLSRGYELMPPASWSRMCRPATPAATPRRLLKRLSIHFCHAGCITPSSRVAGVLSALVMNCRPLSSFAV